MKKEAKTPFINTLSEELINNEYLYITDISGLDAVKTSELRRACFKKNIKLMMVKNTLLKKAMEKTDKNYTELFDVLKGNTALMFSDSPNASANLIKDFRKKAKLPLIKGALIQDMVVIGDENIDFLINIKSKNELIADIILSLKSPAINVISALNSGKHTLAGLVKTLSERE